VKRRRTTQFEGAPTVTAAETAKPQSTASTDQPKVSAADTDAAQTTAPEKTASESIIPPREDAAEANAAAHPLVSPLVSETETAESNASNQSTAKVTSTGDKPVASDAAIAARGSEAATRPTTEGADAPSDDADASPPSVPASPDVSTPAPGAPAIENAGCRPLFLRQLRPMQPTPHMCLSKQSDAPQSDPM
jgi:hypothetical protein